MEKKTNIKQKVYCPICEQISNFTEIESEYGALFNECQNCKSRFNYYTNSDYDIYENYVYESKCKCGNTVNYPKLKHWAS